MADAPACSGCAAPGASPSIGHLTPLCRDSERAWRESKEHEEAATARRRFCERRRAERGLAP